MGEPGETRLDDDRLAEVLASVGRHLAVELVADADARPAPPQPRWRFHPLLAAAAVVALVAAAVVTVAPARHAVGGWLRSGRIDVELDPAAGRPPELPAFTSAAVTLDPAQAAERLGRPLPDVSGSDLGAPTGWAGVPEGGVVAGFADGVTSLWIVDDRDGVLVHKTAGSGTGVAELPGLGDGGFAVNGRHVMQTEFRRVAADRVVVWSDGGLTFRLESTRPTDELIAAAEAMTTPS